MVLRLGSLFSGAGLGDYGLELAGFKTVFQVENDPYCSKILSLRWPQVPKWGDIRKVRSWELPNCDVLAGGFPCQDLSTAGKRAGMDGSRSGLWSEFARIIGDIRSRYVIVENVPGLRVWGFERVLGDLAALGYDAEWESIPASAVGATHERDRVWIVAYFTGTRDGPVSARSRQKRSRKAHTNGYGQNVPDIDIKGPTIFHGGQQKAELARWRLSGGSHWWGSEPKVGRVVHGMPHRVDRIRVLGNGQVVQVAQWIGEQVMSHARGSRP